jgi:hypothetical protein
MSGDWPDACSLSGGNARFRAGMSSGAEKTRRPEGRRSRLKAAPPQAMRK